MNKNFSKKITVLSLVSLLSCIACGDTFAKLNNMGGGGTWVPNGTTATNPHTYSCTAANTNADCLGWSWIYYEYIGGETPETGEGKTINYLPASFQGNGGVFSSGQDVAISGECAHKGWGFWHLGRNAWSDSRSTFLQSYTYKMSVGDFNYRTIKAIGADGKELNYGVFSSEKPTSHKYGGETEYVYHDHAIDNNYYNDAWNKAAAGHRETYSMAYLTNTNGLYGGGMGMVDEKGNYRHERTDKDFGKNVAQEPIKAPLNHTLYWKDQPMYKATKYGLYKDVNQLWLELAANDPQYSSETAMPGNTYAFCWSEDAKLKQEYSGKARIVLGTDSGLNSTFVDRDFNDSNVVQTTTDTIYYKAYGSTWATKNDVAFNETSYKVYSKLDGVANSATEVSHPSNSAWHDEVSAHKLNLVPGVTYKICAVNEYYQTYSNGNYGNLKQPGAEVCVSVRHNIQQTYTGHAKIWVSENENMSTFKVQRATGEVYDENTITEVSSPVYYKASARVLATGSSDYKIPMFQYYSKLANETNSYYINGDDNNDWQHQDNKHRLDLVPGKIYTICAYNDYSPSYSNGSYSASVTESVCVKVISKVECKNFNNAVIGEGGYKNYGRMEVIVGNQKAKVGDDSGNTNKNASLWVKPYKINDNQTTASTSITYYGCNGLQAQEDASGTNSLVDRGYTVMSTVGGSEISGLFNNTDSNNLIRKGSLSQQNINSLEVGLKTTGNKPNNGSNKSDVAERIGVGYQFVEKTDKLEQEAGRVYNNTYTWQQIDGQAAVAHGVDVKVPYNYILDTNVRLLESSKSTVVIGEQAQFEVSASKSARTNNKVNGKYSTNIKSITQSKYWLFTVDKDAVKDDDFADDKVYIGSESDNPIKQIFGSKSGFRTLDGGDDGNEIAIDAPKITLTKEITDELMVGSKVCALSAVWPADSHNKPNDDVIKVADPNKDESDDDIQAAALIDGPGTNPYWRYSVSCSTVGKKPSMSVEGGSLVVGGENGVKTSTISINGGVFGSWTEYDLVAKKVSGKTGSGNSYGYRYATTEQNKPATLDQDGLRDGIHNPQTLGKDGINDIDAYLAASRRFVDNIDGLKENLKSIESFRGGLYYHEDNIGGYTVNLYDFAENSITIDSGGIYIDGIGNGPYVNLLSSSEINIIRAKDISIKNDVQLINATLIAQGTLDTCSEHGKDNNGNQDLLENCSNPLVINGAVYADDINLDRVFGGGSADGTALQANTVSQRAEIFNYDPRIVEISYVINADKARETHVQELAPRL